MHLHLIGQNGWNQVKLTFTSMITTYNSRAWLMAYDCVTILSLCADPFCSLSYPSLLLYISLALWFLLRSLTSRRTLRTWRPATAVRRWPWRTSAWPLWLPTTATAPSWACSTTTRTATRCWTTCTVLNSGWRQTTTPTSSTVSGECRLQLCSGAHGGTVRRHQSFLPLLPAGAHIINIVNIMRLIR